MGTLAKIAIGVVIAKGVGGMMKGGGSGGGLAMPQGFPGGLPGGSGSGRRQTTGLEDMMGDIFRKAPGGRDSPQESPFGQQEPVGRKAVPTDPFGQGAGPVVAEEPGRGGVGDVLGEMMRNGGPWGKAAGGLGDVLGSVLAGSRAVAGGGRGFGDLLTESLRNGGEPDSPPAPEHEAAAALMLQAMIQAAKSDGRIDAAEQKQLTDKLGGATPEEMEFVRKLLQAPIDIAGLCQQVPDGLQPQVYAMSLAAVVLDSPLEAQYMQALADGLGLSAAEVGDIHQKMGVTQAVV